MMTIRQKKKHTAAPAAALTTGTTRSRQARPAAVVMTIWMLFWVPVMLSTYGPQNFLWLCNFALFLILFALWTGNRLILSSQAGTVMLIGIIWAGEILLGLATQGRLALGTSYMWNPDIPLIARLVSVYHVVVPLLVYLVLRRWGYDRRGPWLQCLLGSIAIVGARLLTAAERNVNWVHQVPLDPPPAGISGVAWVGLLLILAPVLIYYPGHQIVLVLLRGRAQP